jgi:hypothetical protein
MTATLPYDPTRPPATPPAGAHPVVWQLAHAAAVTHRPDRHGQCIACLPRQAYPCDASKVAEWGLQFALKVGRHPVDWPTCG